MIERLQLANMLAFQEADLELANLTLLTGTNSSGKTSILHALALLRQSFEAGVLEKSIMLNGGRAKLGTGRDLLHEDPIDLGHDRPQIRITLTIDDSLHTWTADYIPDADVLPVAGSFDPVSFSSGFQYLRADRIVPAETFPKSHEAVSIRGSLGARGEHAPNYLRVNGGAATACEPAVLDTGISSNLMDQTNAWVQLISSGTSIDVSDLEGTDLVRLGFRRQGPQVKSEPHRSTNVGFGLTYALPIVVACLSAAKGTLLLIENPEAHLHPSGQAVLGRLCALASLGGAQVIIETHSDHVLNAIRLAVKNTPLRADSTVVHFFSRSTDALQPEIETLQISADGSIAAWPKGFFDEWDSALSALLS